MRFQCANLTEIEDCKPEFYRGANGADIEIFDYEWFADQCVGEGPLWEIEAESPARSAQACAAWSDEFTEDFNLIRVFFGGEWVADYQVSRQELYTAKIAKLGRKDANAVDATFTGVAPPFQEQPANS